MASVMSNATVPVQPVQLNGSPKVDHKPQNEDYETQWRDLIRPEVHPVPIFRYYGHQPSSTILPAGHRRFPHRRAFPEDVVWDRDCVVPMRDGIKLCADVFRPRTEPKIPAIICWSPYGKTGSGLQHYETMAPFTAGLDPGTLDGYDKFEALCPSEWCPKGYAIVNPDARGAFDSQGNLVFWGQQEAEDIYDLIDWLVQQPWCSGKVCMAGNSWLAISQINHASRCPHPALACIAPWEAFSDPYLDNLRRGGSPWLKSFLSRGKVEDIPVMVEQHPLYDAYWKSKRIPVEKIDIPMYCLASYSSMIHTAGSFRTFELAETKDKWLRVHPYQEWYDLHRPESRDDLQKFFDFYTKNTQNGWVDDTPKVRLSLLGYDRSLSKTIVERPEEQFPPARFSEQILYLDAVQGALTSSLSLANSSKSYQADTLTDAITFVHHFDRRTELVGWSKVRLWVSCQDHDDMIVVVQLRKVDVTGKTLSHVNYPVPVPPEEVPKYNTAITLGPQGVLQASHRFSLDQTTASTARPVYAHDRCDLVDPGSIVELNIGIWPWGAVFEAGEGIALRIGGHDMCLPETEIAIPSGPELGNRGRHIVHTGGDFPSSLLFSMYQP